MSLGLVPEVLNPVDVVAVFSEALGVVDANVMKVRNVEHVIGLEAVRIDDAVWLDLAFNDRQKRFCAGVWDGDGIDLAAAFQKPEDGNFPRRSSASLALADTTEITLVHFDLTSHQVRRFRRQIDGNDLSQLVKKQDRRVAIHAT